MGLMSICKSIIKKKFFLKSDIKKICDFYGINYEGWLTLIYFRETCLSYMLKIDEEMR